MVKSKINPILTLEYLTSQPTALNQKSGKFQIVPEYPEFAWLEGIVNAVTHSFLEDPIYTEPEQSVKLVLKNNIMVRTMRQAAHIETKVDGNVWEQLDDLGKKILTYMGSKSSVTRSELEIYTGKKGRTIMLRLNHLMDLSIVKRNGHQNDPTQTYAMAN